MALSTQRATSDGTLVQLSLSIDYFDRTEISVYIGGLLKPLSTGLWSWVGTTDKKINFTPAIANGVEVMVKRSTDLTEPRHQYTKGAQFVAETIDENFTQMLRIAQEAKEGSTLSEIFNDLDMHGYQIQNLGPATLDNHPVSLGVYKADADGANQAKIAAQASQAAAASSATAAAGSATAAAGSATAAAGSATAASGSQTAAASSATAAAGSATAAGTSQTAAASSATLAQDWATKTSGEVVVGQGYGAKKYANDAASSAAAAATSAASINDAQLVHKTGDESIAGKKQFTDPMQMKGFQEDCVTANATGTYAIDYAASKVTWYNLTLTGNTTLSFANIPTGSAFALNFKIQQDGTGGRTFTIPGTVRTQNAAGLTWTTTANKADFVTLLTFDGGATWDAFQGGKNY